MRVSMVGLGVLVHELPSIALPYHINVSELTNIVIYHRCYALPWVFSTIHVRSTPYDDDHSIERPFREILCAQLVLIHSIFLHLFQCCYYLAIGTIITMSVTPFHICCTAFEEPNKMHDLKKVMHRNEPIGQCVMYVFLWIQFDFGPIYAVHMKFGSAVGFVASQHSFVHWGTMNREIHLNKYPRI